MESRNSEENQKKDKNSPPRFTGWFSGDASVFSYSFIIAGLLANEASKPAFRAYDYIKHKIEDHYAPHFEEQELNDAYQYYKQTGNYPVYLIEKYKEKYPNLHEILIGQAKLESPKSVSDQEIKLEKLEKIESKKEENRTIKYSK